MSRPLPSRPSLEHLRNQAKELLADLRLQHPEAKLSDAQHAVARAYGFLNWPELKAHVETVSAAVSAVPPANPLVGMWTADISKSRRHPANQFQRAMIEFAAEGDVVTITNRFVDEAGCEERATSVVHVDGVERVMQHGYAVTARWRGSHALEVVVRRSDNVIGSATYEVSRDGGVLTTSDMTGEQVIVLDRNDAGSLAMEGGRR